jgi:uncharacterized protein (DUF2141 family)
MDRLPLGTNRWSTTVNPKQLAFVMLLLGGMGCAARPPSTQVVRDVDVSMTARLTVELLGLSSDSGDVAVALYDSADSFETRSAAVASGRIEPQVGSVSWTVEGLDPGDYAVAAYHDLNGNGQLDRSALGPPSEPYGFSNDARGALGPPRFEKATVRIGPGSTTIKITLR